MFDVKIAEVVLQCRMWPSRTRFLNTIASGEYVLQHTAAMPCANFHYIRNHHFCENLGDGSIIVLSTLQGGSDSECHEVVTNPIPYQGSVAVISLGVPCLKADLFSNLD